MFPIESFRNTLTKLVGILRQHDVPFHLTGGVTSITYGEPRMTQDIDLVVDNAATAMKISELLDAFAYSGFLLDETAVRTGVRDCRLFQLLDTSESLKLDIYPRELIAGELSRSESREVFAGLFLPVASLPDAAVSKLIWVSKGSHKNRRDIRQIVSRATAAQLQLINSLASDLGLTALLGEILAESNEIE